MMVLMKMQRFVQFSFPRQPCPFFGSLSRSFSSDNMPRIRTKFLHEEILKMVVHVLKIVSKSFCEAVEWEFDIGSSIFCLNCFVSTLLRFPDKGGQRLDFEIFFFVNLMPFAVDSLHREGS